jgi:hypothetical protein
MAFIVTKKCSAYVPLYWTTRCESNQKYIGLTWGGEIYQ